MNNMIKTGVYILGLVVAGFAGWYLGSKPEVTTVQSQGEVLATINGVEYPKDWFIKQMHLRGGNRPGQYQDTQQKQVLLEYLINQEVMYMQAKAQGLDQEPSIDNMLKKAVVDKFLEHNLNKQIDSIRVSEDDVRQHFESNQMTYNKPARRRAAMIFTERKTSDTAETWANKKSLMEEVLAQSKNLSTDITHFGDLAKTYSEDKSSKYQGGVIGWLIQHPSRQYKWDDAVVESLFSMSEVGEISPVIESEKGLYLVRLVASENIKEKSFEQVKSGIKNQLLQSKRKQVRLAFMQEIQQQADVQIDMKMLAAIPAFSQAKKKPLKPPAMPSGSGGSK